MFTTLEKVGLLCMCIIGFQILRFVLRTLYNNLIAPNLGLHVKVAEMGKWAVVTGATDGLGKAYAEFLARKGLNIVLISRTPSKLEEQARSIETTYKVETKTVAVDFTDTEMIYHTIEKQLSGLEIGVLVNNVGMSYSYPEYFLAINDKEQIYNKIVKCNVTSVLNMCKIVMPGMVDRRKGVVVNVSSTASIMPSPLLSVYSATKSFVTKLSADLRCEYSKAGLVIQCVTPGYVATKMSKIRHSTWMAPSPEDYVRSAMKLVGVHDQTTGYLPHTLLLGSIRTLQAISPKLTNWIVTRTMENIRARALRNIHL